MCDPNTILTSSIHAQQLTKEEPKIKEGTSHTNTPNTPSYLGSKYKFQTEVESRLEYETIGTTLNTMFKFQTHLKVDKEELNLKNQ